ncbi:MAG: class I SAM-dependent methyltransferase, partial [Candidatus Omnitrophica bacterium]|nr:class I SAM-dependent methyltransferase [Candidatus Omnitrophota bacterium]
DKSDIRQFLMMINKLNERGFLTLEDLSRAEVRSGLRHGEDPNLTEPLRKAERPWLQDNELLKWNLRTTTTRTLKFLMERIDERGIFKPEELEGIVLIGGPGFNDTQILEIARRFTRAQFVAVDIDGRSIKFLRNNVLKADPTLAGRIRFLEGDLRDLRHLVDADESVIELPDQSVAVAIYPAVFDIYQNDYQDDYVRLRELGKIISESRRVLKAGGILGAAPFSDAPHKLMQNLGFEDLDPDDRKHESFLLYRKPESPKSISGSEPPTARSEMRSASPARGELRRTDASAVEVAVGALFGVMAKEVWQGLNRSETRALWITIRPASVRVRRDEMTGQKTWRQAPGSESSQIAFPPQGVAARNDRRAGQSSRARQVVFLSPTDQWITSQAETAPVFASAA